MINNYNYKRAIDRIENEPLLERYKEVLIDYDWNDPSHLGWVATAPVDEILDWCQSQEEEDTDE